MNKLDTSALWLCCLLLPTGAFAFSVPGFEPVQSAPVETTLLDPDLRSAAEVWPLMIDAAKKTIDIEQFYVTPQAGEPLDPTLAALGRAGARGVRIRVLAEKKFEKVSAEGLKILAAIPNLEIRIIDFSSIKADGIVHAKFFIVDGSEGYLGSQNLDWRSLKHIHEMGLRVSDPEIVKGLGAVFAQDWKAQAAVAAGEKVPPTNTEPPKSPIDRRAYLVASPFAFNPPGVGDSETELVRLIATAKQELAIELLDYAPLERNGDYYAPIDNALRAAAARGVKVRLMVSHWSTKKPYIDHLKSLAILPGVEIRIVTIPLSTEGAVPFARVIHAKYMVLDGGVLWLGTSNWSGGYLSNSRNVEVVVKDPALAGKLRSVHEKLWTSEYAAAIDLAKDYPKPRK